MDRVLIVDTKLCNLRSITRAVEECGGSPIVSDDARDLDQASRIILPGVGAFPAAMENLSRKSMVVGLREQADRGVPLLGICLGMQLLATRGNEVRDAEGLGLIPGEVRALTPGRHERVPHIGWNEVEIIREHPLFADIPSSRDFYFVHSWALHPTARDDIVATTPFAGAFVSAVARGNIFGVQFHPEKSQRLGLRLLRNFLNL